MGIRIQLDELKIPSDNPFINDLLGRETAVQVLTQIIRSVDGPCVFSIDGPYGSGKTTFLRLWAQYLKNQKFQVVGLNAWETDFSDDPFLALSQGILAGLEKRDNREIQKNLKEFRQIAGEVAARSVPAIARLITMGLLDIETVIGAVTGTAAEESVKEGINQIAAQKKSVSAFKKKLEMLTKEVSNSGKSGPLVIMIDELDRCRPSYAIEMLEVAKHLFSVENIVFVLGVNRSQLAHSVKCLYGQGFNAEAYLKRFFDVDFSLPEPDKDGFIKDLLTRAGIESFFNQKSDTRKYRDERQSFENILYTLLGRSPLTLREISQVIHHLGLVFASLGVEHKVFAVTSAMAVILKFMIPESYHQLRYGSISDSDVADDLFAAMGIPDIDRRVQDACSRTYAEAEAIISACYVESSGNTRQMIREYGSTAPRMKGYWSSSLISKYIPHPLIRNHPDPVKANALKGFMGKWRSLTTHLVGEDEQASEPWPEKPGEEPGKAPEDQPAEGDLRIHGPGPDGLRRRVGAGTDGPAVRPLRTA